MHRPLYVERAFPVRTYDIDFAGHVSNITYVRWLEDLRLAVLEEYFPLERLMNAGQVPVLIHTNIDYVSAIRLFESVTGAMWAHKSSTIRMHVEAEFRVGDRLCARARQAGVLVRLSDGRPIRLPAEFLDLFES